MSREDRLVAIREAKGRGAHEAVAHLLLDGHRADELTAEDLREWVADTWTYLCPPSGPYGAMPERDWVELFRAMGSFAAVPEIELGGEPYTLYRAAPAERARSMSWCTHEAMARGFLPKHQSHGQYRLWTSRVPATAVLAVLNRPTDSWFGPGSDAAREVVVDPERLGDVMAAGSVTAAAAPIGCKHRDATVRS